jgi:hypothetical protein
MNSNLASYEPQIELFVAMAHYSKQLLKNVTSHLAAHDRVYLGSMLRSSQVTGLDQFYTVGFRRLVVALTSALFGTRPERPRRCNDAVNRPCGTNESLSSARDWVPYGRRELVHFERAGEHQVGNIGTMSVG